MLRFLIRLFFPKPRPAPLSPNVNSGERELQALLEKVATRDQPDVPYVLAGRCHVIDGDTIVIRGTKIRIAGIDAPELDHPWGNKSKWALINMCKGKEVSVRLKPELSYDRIVGSVHLPGGTDVAAELVRMGLALDWPQFSGGRYQHLEPPGVRRKLWRAAARQRG